MTAATAPSPSPAPSAPSQHAPTPTRQSPVASDGSSSRRHDGASTSASSVKVTTTLAASNLGTLAKPIDLASPPASPTLVATSDNTSVAVVASDSTRSLHQPSLSPSAATQSLSSANAVPASRSNDSSTTLPRPSYANALPTSNWLLPPTPLGNASERSSTASPSTIKSVQLPAPYKAPRTAQVGASESFATAYPTQETRQKYASPSKPLPTTSGIALSHKRSWQPSGSVDLSNKKFRPMADAISPSPQAATSPALFGQTVLASLPAASKVVPAAATATSTASPHASTLFSSSPLSTASISNTNQNTSSGVTVTNIPKPGSSISNQAGMGPLNLIPAVSGSQLPATVRDEYLSLLEKSELIDLVKQLEKQLINLVEAPLGSSALYHHARIYPDQINIQIDRLKARQRAEAVPTASTTDLSLSLKDVYSLLNATSRPTGSTIPRSSTSNTTSASALPGRPTYTAPTGPRRPLPVAPTASAAANAARFFGTAGHKAPSAKDSQTASLSNLISSITAMARQQNQPARGPNGAPLPPAQTLSAGSAPRSAVAPAGQVSRLTPTALHNIVGDGPMPSNAALAAAITAHFGGNQPAKGATASRPGAAFLSATSGASAAPTASPAAVKVTSQVGSAASNAPNASIAASSTTCAPGPASNASKDISEKIAAILGSSSTSQTTMLGPQGLPLAPAATASGSGAGSGAVPLGSIAAMLSSFAGQTSASNVPTGSADASARTSTPAAQGQGSALSSLLQQLEEAKKKLPPPATASAASGNVSVAPQASSLSSIPSRVNDPVAVLTGASANPIFTPTYGMGASTLSSRMMGGYRIPSWSPEPEPVIVQGPLGTSALPSYEDMIAEGLRIMGQAPPRTLFNWMQDTYPLTRKFRPSAHQALQKAFKRGRLLKTGGLYRLNPSWSAPGESRKPTRRPQVEQDHPMVRPGLNGEVLAVNPLKDSQAYRNVGDSGLRPPKAQRMCPRPYGQPGAAPLANPASTIFPSGTATEILLEYQKRIGKKIEPDSVRYLYQLIRSGPSDGSMEEMLAHMLTQTGYHDAAAEATAAAAAQTAAATAAGMSTYPRPSTNAAYMATGFSSPSSLVARTGASSAVAGAADRRGMPFASAAKGATSHALPSTSEPSMMQQLAIMLSDTSNRFNPALASSILGQLSSNAAAQAAARAADLPGMTTGPPLPAVPARTLAAAAAPAASGPTPSASSQLASALSSLAGQTSQHDLDSAVSETLAAALQQIGAAPTADDKAVEEGAKEVVSTEEVGAAKTVEAASAAAGTAGEGEEGIDLAEYEDAIRALTSAFANADDDADSDESDVEADERAIAAAEAEPDSVDEPGGSTIEAGQADVRQEDAGDTDEDDDDDDEEEAAEEGQQMDLSAVLRQLTASLQAHHENASDGEDAGKGQIQDESAATQSQQPEADHSQADDRRADAEMEDVDAAAEEPHTSNGETAEAEAAEATETGAQDAGSIQAQLEALVASLAANAGNVDEHGENDEDEDDEDDEQDEEEGNAGEAD